MRATDDQGSFIEAIQFVSTPEADTELVQSAQTLGWTGTIAPDGQSVRLTKSGAGDVTMQKWDWLVLSNTGPAAPGPVVTREAAKGWRMLGGG